MTPATKLCPLIQIIIKERNLALHILMTPEHSSLAFGSCGYDFFLNTIGLMKRFLNTMEWKKCLAGRS